MLLLQTRMCTCLSRALLSMFSGVRLDVELMRRTVILFLIFLRACHTVFQRSYTVLRPLSSAQLGRRAVLSGSHRRHFMAQRRPSMHAVTSRPEFSRPGPLLKGTPRLTGLRTNSSHPQPRTTALQLVSHPRLIRSLARSSLSKTFTGPYTPPSRVPGAQDTQGTHID